MGATNAIESGYPEPGDLFAERYRILELIGTGGFSRVYSARQQQLDRRVAVKILAPRGGTSRSSQEIIEKRFYREARLLSRLSGPNTITVHDYGRTSSGLLFMVSELIEGRNLKRLLEAEGPLKEARARRVFTQLLLGLSEVHSHGFLHRDIKPSNVMVFDHLGERDRAKLLDFGIAKGVTVGATDDTALTMTGFVIGTPGYMSPEQALGRPVTRASDVFSAGLIAYEMLTGQSPFRGLSMEQLQRRLMTSPLRLPGTLRIADDFKRVLHRTLAVDPEERYETAARALEDLGVTDSEHDAEEPETPTTPRPPNLLTFPMQLDSSGSTIVDTIADDGSGETTTIFLPGADTYEDPPAVQRTEAPGFKETASEPLPDATEKFHSDEVEADEAGATVVGPVAERRYGLMVWLLGGAVLVAAIGVGIWLVSQSSQVDEQPGAPSSPVSKEPTPAPPTAAPGDAAEAIDAAAEILERSARNAELDAQIRAKEQRLEESIDDGEEGLDFTGEVEPPREPEPEVVPAEKEPAPREKSPASDDVPDEDTERAKSRGDVESPPAKRDFDVTPLDEL